MYKIEELSAAVENGKSNLVPNLVQECLDEGDAPLDVLNHGMIDAMSVVGEKFKKNEIFVPEMLVAARAMKKGVDVLKPHLSGENDGKIGKMVMGTVYGYLHDIGKIAVPDSVLRKAGPLTRPEWEEMRRHPVTGYEILRKIDDFKEIAILVRHHHERWDGRGYPDGLSGHDIPPGSRVIAVADSIDAMMSSRSYRPAMTSAACRREIEKNSGIMYDPRVAAAALEHWDELVSRYAGADTPRTPYFDRLQLEHTRQAHDYLLTHQGSRITLPELAAKFHLSQSSLKICFKALYGVPVASYLRGLRMDTAARLLQESDLPVAEIAHRVGYEDPSRFAAAFRRHTGRRPTELRRVACPTASSHTA